MQLFTMEKIEFIQNFNFVMKIQDIFLKDIQKKDFIYSIIRTIKFLFQNVKFHKNS